MQPAWASSGFCGLTPQIKRTVAGTLNELGLSIGDRIETVSVMTTKNASGDEIESLFWWAGTLVGPAASPYVRGRPVFTVTFDALAPDEPETMEVVFVDAVAMWCLPDEEPGRWRRLLLRDPASLSQGNEEHERPTPLTEDEINRANAAMASHDAMLVPLVVPHTD